MFGIRGEQYSQAVYDHYMSKYSIKDFRPGAWFVPLNDPN